jgi:Mg-chelatase subunit ChlD
MFQFAHPEFLYALLILPVILLVFFFFIRRKKNSLKKFGDLTIIGQLMPNASTKKYHLKFWILFIAVALLIFMIARPQMGTKLETVKKHGVEVMICLDVSNSMMSDDIKPSRLDRAKMILSRLIDDLDDDKIGLIVFAGDAYVQLPITPDFISAKFFLSSINTSMVPIQGTQIGKAIDLATRSFSSNKDIGKTIIIITDGEGHEDNATGAAKAAEDKGITVNVVGIGSAQGGTIPMQNRRDYLRDSERNVVVTKLNEAMCQEIAIAGKGVYIHADNTSSTVRTIQQELDKLSKSEIETKSYSNYNELFPIIAWVLIILLIVEVLILNRKSKLFSKFKLFS